MKRMILFVPLVFLTLGAFAQTRGNRGREAPLPPEALATVTVRGTLEAVNARIAVKGADATYYVFGIDQLIGFVPGLNEGAPVTLEGYETPQGETAEYRGLWVSKLTFNGKDYEIAPRSPQGGPFPGREAHFRGPGGWGAGGGWGCFRWGSYNS